MDLWTWVVVSGAGAVAVDLGRRVVQGNLKKGSVEREASEALLCLANAIMDPDWTQEDEQRLVEELHDVIQAIQEKMKGKDDPTAGID